MSLGMLQRKPDSGLGNIHRSPGAPSRNIDWVLLFSQAALAVIGLFVIYSASHSKFPDPYQFVTRQEIFLIAATIGMFIVMSVDYDWWKERARFLYGATMMLLVLVVLTGAVSGGARLSFDLGPLKLQPAEFAKFTVLLALAAYLSDDESDQVPYHRFVTGLVLTGVPVGLILLQPDLGSASVLVAMVMGMMLVAGAKPKYIVAITVLSLMTVGAVVAAGIVNDYQLNRLKVFFNPDTTDPALRDVVFQGRNAVRAIATGGLTGKGWLEGPITNSKDIPVQWADFPFSAIGEQFGLIGCAVVLGLFGLMLFRIWRIAQMSRDLFGTYLCAGVFTMLLWQVFQNVAMTLGIMPITGLPLPFISYGGSSLVAYFAMLGLVQSVHMRRYR
jgi:rod shape determining protein RodA